MKSFILKTLYKTFPFNLQGDLKTTCEDNKNILFSCLITCAPKREEELTFLLNTLKKQSIGKDKFEIIIFNDQNDHKIEAAADQFNRDLTIKMLKNDAESHFLGKNRNTTLSQASGKYILFLDDDTRLLQNNFLEIALKIFNEYSPDMIMPSGCATFGVIKQKADYLDEYSFATRCCLYTKSILKQIGGFVDTLTAFEDHEMGIRLLIHGMKIHQAHELKYAHPPLCFTSLQKPISFGQSLLRLKKRYSFPIWLTVYTNALRYLVLFILPTRKNRQLFQLSFGVLISPFHRNQLNYSQ